MLRAVQFSTGVPPLSQFRSGGGSPLLVDLTTSIGYYAHPLTGAIVALSAPSSGGGGTQIKGAAWDGAGFTIVTGTSLATIPVYCPDAKTISKVTVITQGGTGSCVIDIWKRAYATYPPTVADTITAASKPTIASAIKYQDAVLTGWTKSVSAGDVLMFQLQSNVTFTYVGIILELT